MTWTNCTLGDVVTLKRGHDLPNGSRVDGNIPVVSSSGITGYHNEAKAEPPGVVTGRYGTIGQVFYITQPYWPLNTALYAVDFHGNDPRFVSYFLRNKLRDYQSDKAAVPGVDRKVLHKLPAKRPNIDAQGKIVSILSAYDDLIVNNERRAEILERSTRLLFEEWFIRLRYPGHESYSADTVLPKTWETSTVGGVCSEFIDGDWLETKDQGGNDFRILQISNIGDNNFVETGNHRYITDETFRRLGCTEVKIGDILIARMPEPIGRAWLVTKQEERMVTAVDVTIARPDVDKIDAYYILYHLNSAPHIARCQAGATGATRPRVAKRVMAALPIVIPPMPLQKQFRHFAETANHEIANLIRQNLIVSRARDFLLPRLMDGKIAV